MGEKLDDSHRRWMEELKNDRNQSMPQLSLKIEDNGKEIENKKGQSTLLCENKQNRNNENIKHMEKKRGNYKKHFEGKST